MVKKCIAGYREEEIRKRLEAIYTKQEGEIKMVH